MFVTSSPLTTTATEINSHTQNLICIKNDTWGRLKVNGSTEMLEAMHIFKFLTKARTVWNFSTV